MIDSNFWMYFSILYIPIVVLAGYIIGLLVDMDDDIN